MNDHAETVKLRDKMEQVRIDVARLQEQAAGNEKALELATKTLDAYKANSNEWRQENLEQRAIFPSEDKVHGWFETVNTRVGSLENSTNIRLASLEASRTEDLGKRGGFSTVWGVTVTVILIVLAAAGLAVHFWK